MNNCKNCGHPVIGAGGKIYHLGKRMKQQCDNCDCNNPELSKKINK